MNKGKLFALIGGIFGLLGVVMLGAGVAWAVSTAAFQASAERTEGTVVALTERTATSSLRKVWYPTVEYTVDGRVYSFDSSFATRPPAYAEGDTVSVAYNQADPSDAQIVTFWSMYLGPMIFGGLGMVFTPIGAALFVKGRRALQQRAWLLRKGREVWAEIADVGVEFDVNINGRHPFVVHATWHDESTGRTHTATSDMLRHDPGPGLRGRNHVRVLFDPADPDRNVVDLDSVR
jgi:uncharacterized protein DUF3592